MKIFSFINFIFFCFTVFGVFGKNTGDDDVGRSFNTHRRLFIAPQNCPIGQKLVNGHCRRIN